MRGARDSGLTFKLELTDILEHDLDDYTLIELADTRGSRRYRNSQQVQRAVTLSGIRGSPAGYRRTRSFKTKDPHGSLQLTCFRSQEAGEDYLVDADIDEAQGIDPGYRFLFT